MNNLIERQLESFKNNLDSLPYNKKVIKYNKARQIIENSYDSYDYFTMILFDKFIYKNIDNKNELQIAFKEVRNSLKFLLNQIKFRFPKEFLHLKYDDCPNTYSIDRTIISEFKMKIKANIRINGYISLANWLLKIIDSIDYVYLNNKALKNVDVTEGNILTIDSKNNKTFSFDTVIYNIKQRIKEVI